MASKDTRTNIMDVAQDLIQRRGVNGMSFQDISDAVEIRKASIHHHFASKQDLVEALVTRYRADFGALLTEILNSRAKARGKLLRYGSLFEGTLQAGNQDKSACVACWPLKCSAWMTVRSGPSKGSCKTT